jgi:hypothetical protein
MATINELRAEIAKEKSLIENEEDMQKLGQERKALENELKQLRFKRKYGKYSETAKPIISGVKTTFLRITKKVHTLQENQLERERREKAIKKKGFTIERRGLFG